MMLSREVQIMVTKGTKDFEKGVWQIEGRTIKNRNMIAAKAAEGLMKKGNAVINRYAYKLTFERDGKVVEAYCGNQEELVRYMNWVNKEAVQGRVISVK